jgi:hypothetical protein
MRERGQPERRGTPISPSALGLLKPHSLRRSAATGRDPACHEAEPRVDHVADHGECKAGYQTVDDPHRYLPVALKSSVRGQDEASHAVLELPHGWMFFVSSGGLLRGDDDKTLNALVAIAKKHEIKLILYEPNYGGGVPSGLLVSALQQDPYELGVEDTEGRFVVKDQRIVDVLEPAVDHHRLTVGPSAVEQDFDCTKHIDGKRRSLDGLFHQMPSMVGAEIAPAQDGRLYALAAAAVHVLEDTARDAHMAAMDHKAR